MVEGVFMEYIHYDLSYIVATIMIVLYRVGIICLLAFIARTVWKIYVIQGNKEWEKEQRREEKEPVE
jgi:hypothetical protein